MVVRLEDLREQRAQQTARLRTLAAELTAEGIAEDVAADLESQIEAISGDNGSISALDRRIATLERVERIESANALEVSGQASQDPPRIRIPARARRYRSKHIPQVERNGYDADTRAFAIGQWFLMRLAADMPGQYGGPAFVQAKEFCEKHGLAEGRWGRGVFGALPTGTDDPGLGIPETFSSDMIILQERYGLARNVFRRRPIPVGGTVHIPGRGNILIAYFKDEKTAGTTSEATWTDSAITPKTIQGLTYYTRELDITAIINLGDELMDQLARAIAYREDFAAFAADGTADGDNGGFTGLLNAITATVAGPSGSATDWSGIALSDFHAMIAAIPDYADSMAEWICHRSFWAGVMQPLLTAGQGNQIVTLQNGARAPLFLGYPVRVSQVFPSSATAAEVVCTFGSHSMGCSYATKQEIDIRFSEHATIDGNSMFQRGEIAVLGDEMFGSACHHVGAGGPVVGLLTGV